MIVRSPANHDEFQKYYELRWQVLRSPWAQPRGSERDELDDFAEHAAVFADDGRALAVGRLHLNTPEEAQIRYMAVVQNARGRGLGRRIVEYLEGMARQRGAKAVVLNARAEVIEFYRRLGYGAVGEGPTMFGAVAHVRMAKDFS